MLISKQLISFYHYTQSRTANYPRPGKGDAGGAVDGFFFGYNGGHELAKIKLLILILSHSGHRDVEPESTEFESIGFPLWALDFPLRSLG
jgi:hypothetical protein